MPDREVRLSSRGEVRVANQARGGSLPGTALYGGKTRRQSVVGRGPASHNWNQPPSVGEMEMGAAGTHLPLSRAWPLGGQM